MKLRKNEILRHFRDMIRLKTISSVDSEETEEAFAGFRELLKREYPAVFRTGEGWLIGGRGVLIRIPGRSAAYPSVLMAHMDVVPAGDGWVCDPFSAELRENRVWGRGTLDTKSTLCAIMEAAEYCAENHIVPRNDLYLSFGAEEEISGECCSMIVQFLKERGVTPDLVLDEGGSVIPEGLPGVRKQAAMVGIAEKGTANYMVSIQEGQGGHASVPPKHTVIGRLCKAAVEIENHPFPARLSTPVQLMFREMSKEVPLPERPAFAHPELTSPAIRMMASALGGTFNAMVRSTAAITIIQANSAFNVLPDKAAMGVNMRLLEGDTVESAAASLRSIIKDPGVRVDLISGTDPTPVSEINCKAWYTLKRVISRTWKDTIVAPYQMNGGTDSRFYTDICRHIYRFSPMVMTKEERSSVHGKNESISVDVLMKAVVFYIRLMKEL